MLLIVGAVVVGIVAGLLLGGSLRTLADVHFRWWPLALVGFGLQVIPVPSTSGRIGHWLAVGLLVASYAVLLLFVGANARYIGFWLVGLGFALNILVIGVNGGMPVSERALRQAYGPGYQETLRHLVSGGKAKHHLARSDDVLLPLSDVIPVGGPVRNVFSLGDLIALLGVAWVLAEATKMPAGKHRVGTARSAASLVTLGSPAEPVGPGSAPIRHLEMDPPGRTAESKEGWEPSR